MRIPKTITFIRASYPVPKRLVMGTKNKVSKHPNPLKTSVARTPRIIASNLITKTSRTLIAKIPSP